MRCWLLVLPILLAQVPAASAQVALGIGMDVPGISIGINLPIAPELQRVPGYPVYYAPQSDANYFFYDGLYWVYQRDEWFASSWYNGPWRRVGRYDVPVYVLRVPVRYYRQPPVYFGPWRADAPPRWGEYWGPQWQQQRPGWDRWDRRAAPAPAPLPTYQRRFPESRYPQDRAQQESIRNENYRHQPNDPVARQQFQLPDAAPQRQGARPVQHPAPRPAAASQRNPGHGAPPGHGQGKKEEKKGDR